MSTPIPMVFSKRTGCLLPKKMDFNPVSQTYVSYVALQKNNITRKSLNYQTPIDCFMDHVGEEFDERVVSLNLINQIQKIFSLLILLMDRPVHWLLLLVQSLY